MSRSLPPSLALLFLCLAIWIPAGAQTTAEAGMAAGASSVGAAGTGNATSGIGGLLQRLDEALHPTKKKQAANTAPSAASTPKRSVKSRPARRAAVTAKPIQAVTEPPEPNYEDAVKIPTGITRDDLLRRFGPPALLVSNGGHSQTLSYLSDSGMVQVELRSGSVVSVSK